MSTQSTHTWIDGRAKGRAVVLVGAIALVWVAAGSAGKPPPPCTFSAGVTIARTTVTGTPGNDNIDCQNAKRGMTINGGGGNDFIVGGPKGDTIHLTDGLASGQGGNDTIIADAGGNSVNAGGDEGDDFIDLTSLSGTLSSSASGGAGNDVINGSPGRDNIGGDAGDDSLNGNGGPDSVSGEDGSDQLSGGDGDDELTDGQYPDSNEVDLYDAGETGETAGDYCNDYDGTGAGTDGTVGSVSAVQDDIGLAPATSSCETIHVAPALA
ncbi:MAG: hypothetical protein HW413_1601 [Thermoleophilia bacterium]|nr:hypothetical protein [Thermoleophilia bacterium]